MPAFRAVRKDYGREMRIEFTDLNTRSQSGVMAFSVKGRNMTTLSRVGLAGLVLAAMLLSSRSALAQVKVYSPADLAIGKLAPEISGVDVDGRKFKLSDYRGKVVVLDFWGDW